VQGQGLQVLQHLHQTFLGCVTEWPTPSTRTGAGTGASGSPAPAPDILRMCDRMANTEHLCWCRDTGGASGSPAPAPDILRKHLSWCRDRGFRFSNTCTRQSRMCDSMDQRSLQILKHLDYIA
jgi:hypothetical protein